MINKNNLNFWRFLPLLLLAFIAFKLINQTEILYNTYSLLMTLISPIVWAIVIAYLLNPVLKASQKHLHMSRLAGALFVYTLLLILLVGLVIIIVPTITKSISDIVLDFPAHVEDVNKWANDRLQDMRSLEQFINTYDIKLESLMPDSIVKQMSDMTNNLKDVFLSMGRTLFDITSGLFKFIMGLILSLYILLDKEALAKSFKRTTRAFLGEKKARCVFELLNEVDIVFGKYLIGKTIDSIIIGIICYFGLYFLGVRYALLFSLVVAVTNMIPYFGPFIGAFPTIAVTFLYSPIQAFWVAVFILVLQQVDGNIIGPMILGERVGMSPLWIIIAILFGGGLFGIPGMLLGVPVSAVIRNIVNRHVDSVLSKRQETAEATDECV